MDWINKNIGDFNKISFDILESKIDFNKEYTKKEVISILSDLNSVDESLILKHYINLDDNIEWFWDKKVDKVKITQGKLINNQKVISIRTHSFFNEHSRTFEDWVHHIYDIKN